MMIALIADIHGNHAALGAMLKDVPRSVEEIVFLGDMVGYYPFASRCVSLLKGHPCLGVVGNHDELLRNCWKQSREPDQTYRSKYGNALEICWVERDADTQFFLDRLPSSLLIERDGKRLMFVHGSPSNHLEGRIYPDHREWLSGVVPPGIDLLAMGHTHHAFYRHVGTCIVMNPGSVGQSRDGYGACYALLDTETLAVMFRRVSYDSGEIVADAQTRMPDMPYLWEVLSR